MRRNGSDTNSDIAAAYYSGPRCEWVATWLRAYGSYSIDSDIRSDLASVVMDCHIHFVKNGQLLVGLEKENSRIEYPDFEIGRMDPRLRAFYKKQRAYLDRVQAPHEERLARILGTKADRDELAYWASDPLMLFQLCSPEALALNELVWKSDRGEKLTPNRRRRGW